MHVPLRPPVSAPAFCRRKADRTENISHAAYPRDSVVVKHLRFQDKD